jgi:uncharacterized membrane protein YfcA
MTPIFIGLGIGAISGVVAALCGVGGGIVMVPAFTMLLGLDQKTAAATSLGAIVLMAIAATAKNQSNGFIDWKIAMPCALAGAVVAWFAADLLKSMSNQTLTRIFAVLLIGAGIQMLFKK